MSVAAARRHDRTIQPNLVQAALRRADKAKRYIPRSRSEVMVTWVCRSRDALVEHLATMHNWHPSVHPVACLSNKELRALHEAHFHQWDPGA